MSEIAGDSLPFGVGNRIAAARRSNGLTQRQLADALGTSIWTIEGIETGAVDASRHLSTIADVTHSDRDWFCRPPKTNVKAPRVKSAELAHLGAAERTLILGSIILLVTIRFFTEVVPMIPRAANFVDIPILVALALAAATVPVEHRYRPTYLSVGLPAMAFLFLSIASAIVNSHRAAPAPVLVFIYGFLAPLAIYAAVYRIWPPGSARALSRVLIGLGLLQFAVVALIDLRRFAASGGNADVISGTFGTNAYQLVFFLLVVASLLVGIFTLEPRRRIARLVPVIIPAIFVVILLAQYRALLATTVVTMVAVGVLLGRHARGVLAAVLAVIAFAFVFSYVASRLPELKLDTTATTLTQSPWSYAGQRLEGARPVSDLYRDEPTVSVIGTGPGTFSSRAWQTFALTSTSRSNVQGPYARKFSGGTVYTTDVSQKYVVPQLKGGDIIEGSRALSSPYSSYLGLAAEVGLLGLTLVVGVYLAALLRSFRIARREIADATPDDPVPALALATTIGFLTLLQMGFLENWLEVTRITFIVWAMFAVVTKELDSRSAAAP
jgi:transcriptional regulator with XRE-family HTH domain